MFGMSLFSLYICIYDFRTIEALGECKVCGCLDGHGSFNNYNTLQSATAGSMVYKCRLSLKAYVASTVVYAFNSQLVPGKYL